MTYHILISVDDTTESLSAAVAAANISVDLNADVRVLTVVEQERDGGASVPDEHRQAASNLLEFVRRKVCDAGVEPSRVEVRQSIGDPFHRILDEARSWPADIVVMAVSDRRGVRSNYVGSVTEQVIEFSDFPVLVVPTSSERRAT